LERFSRFGTRLDEETRSKLEHGYRVREVLKQPQSDPIPVPEQIGVLLAASEGLFDDVDVADVGGLTAQVRRNVREEFDDIAGRIEGGESLEDEDKKSLLDAVERIVGSGGDAGPAREE
jgi:F-type H+-transporting ATPase subunit alpha